MQFTVAHEVNHDWMLVLRDLLFCCTMYVQDLQHPNEFIRGSTLRFLCKLKEPELIEPLMPAIRSCLEHRHSYVRRNAVLAIFTIFKLVAAVKKSYLSYFICGNYKKLLVEITF